MFHSLDHVVAAVADLESATRDTARLLGRAAAWRGAHPGAGTANALFQLENTYLELLAPEGQGPLGARVQGALDSRGEGLLALAFGTDDASSCARTLAERGVEATAPADGEGRDEASGARRSWRNVFLSSDSTRGLTLFGIEHREGALPPSPPTGEASACVAALDHVVVESPDVEASHDLYAAQLGLRLALDRSFEARGLRLLFFRVGGVTVEVAGRLGAAPGGGGPDQFGGLAWRVPDADAARKRLTGAGFDVSEVRAGAKPGTRVFTVRDGTHGVPTLILEPAQRLPSQRPGG